MRIPQPLGQGLLGILLGTQLGCLSVTSEHVKDWLQPPVSSEHVGRAQLPSEEAAQVCRSMGDSMAASGHLAEAILQYETARSHDPKLIDLCYPLAVLHDRIGNDQKAFTEFQKAIAAAPDNPEIRNDLGYFHYCRGEWKAAEQQFRIALEIQPKFHRAWVNLGLTLGQQRRYDESLEAFEKVLVTSEARCNLAFIYATQGRLSEAIQTCQQAIQLDPGYQPARRALEYYSSGPDLPQNLTSKKRPSPLPPTLELDTIPMPKPRAGWQPIPPANETLDLPPVTLPTTKSPTVTSAGAADGWVSTTSPSPVDRLAPKAGTIADYPHHPRTANHSLYPVLPSGVDRALGSNGVHPDR